MPDYAQKQTTTGTSGPTTAPAPSTSEDAQDLMGNDFVKDQVPDVSAGRLTYREALGDMLGDALYDQLEDQLTDEKFIKHAHSAVDSAMEKLEAYFKDNTAPSDHEAATLFVQALQSELEALASKAVINSNVAGGAQSLADENPYAVAAAALAGAAAYILTNQDLPLLEKKVGLGGGHALLAGVDIGRTMDLALEQVRVGYRYESAGTKAELTGDYFQDGGWQATGMFMQTLDPGEQLKLQGMHVQRPGDERSRLDLSYTNPNMAASAYWERMYGEQNVDAYGGSISTVGEKDDLNAYLRGEYRTDGSYTGAAGVSKQQDNSSWSLEGYTGQTATGQQDSGIRAMFKWTF